MILNILFDMILHVISLFDDTHAQEQFNSMLASFPSWVLDTLQERQERHEYPMWVTDR